MNGLIVRLLWLALFGALGTLARYFLDAWVTRAVGPKFPWGILIVNGLGCLLFGLLYPISEQRLGVNPETTRFLLLTGFMGAFTTYSTFTFQTADLMRQQQWGGALLNVAAQLGLGFACMFAGLALGARWIR